MSKKSGWIFGILLFEILLEIGYWEFEIILGILKFLGG